MRHQLTSLSTKLIIIRDNESNIQQENVSEWSSASFTQIFEKKKMFQHTFAMMETTLIAQEIIWRAARKVYFNKWPWAARNGLAGRMWSAGCELAIPGLHFTSESGKRYGKAYYY